MALATTSTTSSSATPFDNIIIGRGGFDILRGQGGADTFVFDRAFVPNNVDTIVDFASGKDRLKIKAALVDGVRQGPLDAAQFVAGSQAGDADDRLLFDRAAGKLWYDSDGVGDAAPQLVAVFLRDAQVLASDIDLF